MWELIVVVLVAMVIWYLIVKVLPVPPPFKNALVIILVALVILYLLRFAGLV